MNKRITISLAVILLLAGGVAFAMWESKDSENDAEISQIDESLRHDEDGDDRSQLDKTSSDDSSGETTDDNGEREVSSPEYRDNLQIEQPQITRAEQSGDDLRIAAIFSSRSTGTCTLRLSKSGENTIEENTQIVPTPNYYACNGFTVPISELPSSGTWDVTVIHKLDGSKNSSEVRQVNVE